jgi:general secretion pathway protein F
VMKRYPYLYPYDVVGSLRAGEMTGHLDQACTVVADQKESSVKLRRKLTWFAWLFLGTIASIPINYAAINGSLKSMERQDAAGGNLNVKDTLITAMKEEAIKVAPWAVPTLLGIVAMGYIWNTMPLRRVRHAAVLWVPFLGGRAKAEAMARFTWAMALISRGGVSPQQTFQLAADTVPNDIIRDRLVSTGSTMHESERLSSALKRANVLPVEFGHIIETGETTGNVPRALEDVNRATDADFRGRDSTAGKATGIMLNLGIALITLVAAALLYQMFFTKSMNIYMKTD